MKKYKATKRIEEENVRAKPSMWKRRKLLWIMAGFIIVIMVGSVLTLMIRGDKEDSKETEYNGHKFTYDSQKGWVTTINGQEVSFEVLPSDVENVKRESFLGMDMGKTYVMFNPSEFSERSYEISRLLGFISLTGRQAFPACSTEDNCGDLPVMNCSDSGDIRNNVVYLVSGNETVIRKDGRCLILEAKPGDEGKIVLLFVYQLLGIVK